MLNILPKGFVLPLTVTLSICLIYLLAFFVIMLTISPEIKRGTPNYFVAASNLEAIFTFGDKYEASIL